MDMTSSGGFILKDTRKVGRVLARVGDKWSVFVIVVLLPGPRRFNDVKRSINGISQQMLTRTLRGLERDGIVARTIRKASPPQVEYALTPLGQSLSDPVLALSKWACDHIEQVDAAQSRFDEHSGRSVLAS